MCLRSLRLWCSLCCAKGVQFVFSFADAVRVALRQVVFTALKAQCRQLCKEWQKELTNVLNNFALTDLNNLTKFFEEGTEVLNRKPETLAQVQSTPRANYMFVFAYTPACVCVRARVRVA